MTESKNDPTRRRLDQITATRTDSPEGMVIARQLLSAVEAVLELCDMCDDAQHGYAVDVGTIRDELTSHLGVTGGIA